MTHNHDSSANRKLAAVDRLLRPGVTVPQGADAVDIGEVLVGMSLAARIAKPPSSRRFDPVRLRIEWWPPSFPAYKHCHGDGQY
ncbi:hypothetical protein [Streptomyces sp. NPDC007904]|uniref:hypothetical protein n=1 Tax=Streptomyces sp. NPDC007904 TaxID=3364787 RepID=UPI0036E68156